MANGQVIGEGFDLERSGQQAKAAELYFATLRGDPTNLPALLGLERVLPQVKRLPEFLPYIRRAVALDSTNAEFQGLLLRLYIALNEPDTARAIAQGWARRRPGDPAPYREWAIALEDVAAYEAAREVLFAGRQALAQPAAFAIELAELRIRLGDWVGAAREWRTAVTASAEQVPNAAAQLGEAPQDQRQSLEAAIVEGNASPYARRLAAELLLGWGDPESAWTLFGPTVTTQSRDAVYALQRFADLAGALGTPAAWRVRGRALAQFAGLVPEPLALRARTEAARSFLEGGDAAGARVQLQQVAANPNATLDAQQLAQATLIGAWIQEGQLDSATARIATSGRTLADTSRTMLRFALARARIRHGQLMLADSALARDSSVEALALYGWIALYRGDVTRARKLMRLAGPYAGDRHDATQRTAMLALTERIADEQFPLLGKALLSLAQGDSSLAIATLRHTAEQLPPDQGRGDVLLFAGRVAARMGTDGQNTADSIFEQVVRMGGSGAAAPAAELDWARLLIAQGRTSEAAKHLEHLILTYPTSAAVPEARRQLEQTKGAIPKS